MDIMIITSVGCHHGEERTRKRGLLKTDRLIGSNPDAVMIRLDKAKWLKIFIS